MIQDDVRKIPRNEEDASWLAEILKSVTEAGYTAAKKGDYYEIFDPECERLIVVPTNLRREKLVKVELSANFFPVEKDHTYNLETMIDSSQVLQRRGWEFGREEYRRMGVVIGRKGKSFNYVYRITVGVEGEAEKEVRKIVKDVISLR